MKSWRIRENFIIVVALFIGFLWNRRVSPAPSGINSLVLCGRFLNSSLKIRRVGRVPANGVKVASPATREMWRSGMFYVYILHSVKSNRYYVGCSENILRRLAEHNTCKVSSTKAYVPWKLIYSEKFANKSEAFKREKEIKSFKSGIRFKQLVMESWQSG